MPQAINFLIDRGVFFNVSIRLRDIRLRLKIVIIAHEIFDRVIGEKLLEFAVQLSGQRLIVRQHQRGFLELLNDIGHGKCLAGPGYAQQHLMLISLFEPFIKLLNRFGLVAARLIWRYQLKLRHMLNPQTLFDLEAICQGASLGFSLYHVQIILRVHPAHHIEHIFDC